MNAKCTLLTHFSQRYPRNLSLELAPHHNVAAAFDFLCVNLRHHDDVSAGMRFVGDACATLLRGSGTEEDEYVDVE